MALPLTWLDVFTREPLSGNQLAVVHDADGLDEATMQAFARETKLSETTFVQQATAPGADYRNRIWWQKGEMPFAGHPSLGTAVAVAVRRGLASASFVQQTPAGLQPIDVVVEPGGLLARASMLQEPAVFGEELAPADVLPVLGLEAGDGDPELSPQIVSTGAEQLLIPVRGLDELRRCAPQLGPLTELLRPRNLTTAYVVAVDGENVCARSFFDDPTAVSEDPATGSAAGPLCAYLARRRGTQRVRVDQGVEMGRPSRLDAEIAGDRVRVSGDVVVLAEGRVQL